MVLLRRHVLALILAAVAIFAWWQRSGIERDEDTRTHSSDRRPDYTVDSFNATIMDATGRPDRRLSAQELRHYPDDDSTELDQPRLTLFNPGAPPWLIQSESGWVSADGEEVLLSGEVSIDREPDAASRALQLRTDELLVIPGDDYAETDRPMVAISGRDWLSSAGGGRVWFGNSVRIALAGRVRAQLSVEQKKDDAQVHTGENIP
jgi:lipopolysaccharide export system protein LptC